MKPKYTEEEFKKSKYKDKLLIECYNCGKDFLKIKDDIVSVLRGVKNISCKFCSRKCFFEFKKLNNSTLVNCNTCHKQFSKRNKEITLNNYCSRSCSVKANNKNRTKKVKVKVKKPKFEINNYTILDLLNQGWKKYSIHSSIRKEARIIAKQLGWNKCDKCEYNKHIEIAHIKPIVKFDDNTKIKDINKNNIVPLCPNCHWEYDNYGPMA